MSRGVDVDGDCLRCGFPANNSSGHGTCDAACHGASSKSDVRDWDSEATYVCTFPNGDHDGACDVEVQVGEAGGLWYLRTTDDAGGSDEANDVAYATEDAAREAACEFAAERDEGDGTQDAEEYLAAQLAERAGAPCEDGEWCVWWSTALDGESRVDARYATKEQANAACEIANESLHAANPGGNLLCGYEVRTLLQGRWIRVEDEE